ncbi:hypothetical protein VSA01S_27540 [Vibrio sagamiensis NBRC 104589]|uniref:Uncharacterized protein n=1 Tax=Vibrio sagamiensis NBRC 104589 TaxID=1219064 RepID=A0A511QJK4_9VIBR|nr:hypothetical protein VSA01S_27540 [Vibrio sagamiensis NBRC 104589]
MVKEADSNSSCRSVEVYWLIFKRLSKRRKIIKMRYVQGARLKEHLGSCKGGHTK